MANVNQISQAKLFATGAGVNDNDLLFTTSNVQQFSLFTLMSTTGAVDVEASVDGVTFSTSVIAMQDMAAPASGTFVLVTAALGIYTFRGKFTLIRVRQNGATAANARLLCGN